ncbi:endoplasmic reticulum membrane protein [Rhizoctonia solani]|uniref:Endoplasmic reticulum membrane protein n=1 Tax=Rhizoctonia solani TaxID=456999 RepID=A0A8H8SRR0_9AGAM|nr:endoplasmic reticulum membrane protein [Rhizoctonia solani]QRW16016.1 endoplasmic reticulum membrane protein [Rhizoctonia solani]
MSAPPLLSFLTPAPAVFPSEEYDGFQLRWKNVVFRPAEFKYEGFILLAIFAYVALYFFGFRLISIYAEQFSRPANGSTLLSDGASDYFAYSTGRRGVHYAHTIFTMVPRHDIFQIIYQKLYGLIDLQYAPEDEVLLDIKLRDKDGLNGEGKGFVWGVIAKKEMQALRKNAGIW